MATKTLADKVCKAREAGGTYAAVAEQFGLTVNQVRRLTGYVPPAKRNGQAVKTIDDRRHDEQIKKLAAKVNALGGQKPKTKPAKASAKSVRQKVGSTQPTPSLPAPAKAPAKAVTTPPKAKVDKGVGVVDIAMVKAAELHRWLSDVQPFAGTDDTLPMLTGTHVEWDGKRFLAATTDRFTLGISKLDVPEPGVSDGGLKDVEFMLARNDVAALLRIAKTAKRDEDWRQVTISRVGEIPKGCTVPTFTYRFTFFSGETLTVKPFDAEFPKFKQLIPSGPPVARALSAFTVDYLAKFAKVTTDRARRIQLYSFDDNEFGGAKPTVALIGDNFIGLIMPVRCEDAKWVKPGWIA
jgi:hypothetical protein